MKHTPDLSYVNGKPGQSIAVTDRGLNYGDGLFETILCCQGQLILFDEHLQRLLKDSRRLYIQIDEQKLKNELDVLLVEISKAGALTGVVKIVITRAFSGRGYGYNKNADSNRLLQYYAGLSYPNDFQRGVRLSLADYRLGVNRELAGIKHLNRLDQVLAYNAVQRSLYQESIVSGSGGELVECVTSNLFIIKAGELFTPDLSQAGVQGVMRDYILTVVAPRLRIASHIKKLYIDDLMKADEVFICNSVFGLWPVIAVHVKEYVKGEGTAAIQQEINKLGYGVPYL